jgi:hypothetical protein
MPISTACSRSQSSSTSRTMVTRTRCAKLHAS